MNPLTQIVAATCAGGSVLLCCMTYYQFGSQACVFCVLLMALGQLAAIAETAHCRRAASEAEIELVRTKTQVRQLRLRLVVPDPPHSPVELIESSHFGE